MDLTDWLSVNRAFFMQNLPLLNTAKQQKIPHPQCLNLGGDYTGYNIKWLMRMILQKGIKPFLFLFFAQELRALFENLTQIAARFQTKPINLQPNLV